MKKLLKVFWFALMLIGSLLIGRETFAKGAGFSLEAVFPENQISDASYFDLKVKPKEKQKIEVRVTNMEGNNLTVLLTPTRAFTNDNGIIDYTPQTEEQKKRDKAPQEASFLPDLMSEPQKIELAPKESKVVSFDLTMPEFSFEGIILGSIYATREEEKENNEKVAEGFQLKNQYALVLGVRLKEDFENEVTPNLKMNEIRPENKNGYPNLLVNLENPTSTSFGEMEVIAKVYKKGSNKIYRRTDRENQSMAPYSNYNYAIDWEDENLKPGDYQLHLTAKSKDNFWEFKEDFTIEGKEATKVNKDSIVPRKNYLYPSLVAVLSSIILILGFLLFKGRGS